MTSTTCAPLSRSQSSSSTASMLSQALDLCPMKTNLLEDMRYSWPVSLPVSFIIKRSYSSESSRSS